ncbi:IclR family transcriptional regulator [Rhodococcus opacus]|uniref:IclR family transcriptional regulator n=1 Tax=Rhodococcus opacus TaxID=37919 RepID=UPI00294A4838|nr:IclR family transcriptional regulator [Rhodococcus opacus]MDV6247080.1 IclR family transcriptional regulator [Rhodococcus opacus]
MLNTLVAPPTGTVRQNGDGRTRDPRGIPIVEQLLYCGAEARIPEPDGPAEGDGEVGDLGTTTTRRRHSPRDTGKAVSAKNGNPDTSEAAMPVGAQAVGRALAVLGLLTRNTQGVPVTRIAEELELTPGTAHRLVRALLAEGYVARDPAADSFYLGNTAILLGQAAQRALGVERARTMLEHLNAETDESINLVIRHGDQSLIIMRIQSTLPLRFEQHPGDRYPLYSTASGKAILAFAEDRDEYLKSLPKRLSPLTPSTLKTPASLASELRAIQQRGYSIDNEEAFEGVLCVAAPVLGPSGAAHAAVGIQAPMVRMRGDRVADLGARVAEVASQVATVIPPEAMIWKH